MIKFISCITTLVGLFVMVGTGLAETEIINTYDLNGNLVKGDGRYYEYNDANQLARVRQGNDQTGPVIAEYFYDSGGQRVKKIENGVTTYYVGKHFEKQVGGANAGNTSYYFGEGGERVAKKDQAGNIFYYHLDHLDGINAVTDSAGTLVSKTDYLPFGDVRAGSSGTEKYTYTGKEKDKTDLYYFNARYNSPEFRHFTQADIAEPDYGDPQDLNRYAYVGNNPLSYVDYDGFKKKKKEHKKKHKKEKKKHKTKNDKDDDDDDDLPKGKLVQKAGNYNPRFSYGQCTAYVASKFNVSWGGNAGTWYANAKDQGYAVGKEAKDGAIIVTSESNWGHVAIIEDIKGGQMLVSEFNFEHPLNYDTRWLSLNSSKIIGYIYTYKNK